MAENELTDVKSKPSELDATTTDFIPLTTPKSKVQDNNSEPNAKNGNGPEKIGQKRIQTTPIDATDRTSKKPRINSPADSQVETKGDGDKTNIEKKRDEVEMDQDSDIEEFYLTVNNLPTNWTYVQIKNYLDQECGHVDEMEMLKHKKSKNCAIRLTFQSIEKCKDVSKKLENKYVQDKKLKVKISDTYTTFPTIQESDIKQCSNSNKIVAATTSPKSVTVPNTIQESNIKQSSISNKIGPATTSPKGVTNTIQESNIKQCSISNKVEAATISPTGVPNTIQESNIKQCSISNKIEAATRSPTGVTNTIQESNIKQCSNSNKIGAATTSPIGVTVPNTIQESNIKQCSISNKIVPATRWRPDLDSWDIDPEGLYGLRPEFLKALDIKPPLIKMVHVTNFRCDKNELKEVMELAGNVLMCCVITSGPKYAKVMYSHPLEAVQAISMLNGQLYYGSPLKITIDKNPADSIVLPKGLANIGQGLGIKARPIRNIAQQYHRYASKRSSVINPIIFSEIDFSAEHKNKIKENDPAEIEKNIKEFRSSRIGSNILNPTVPFKVQNIDQLECQDSSMDASDLTTTETSSVVKTKKFGKKNSIGSPQDQTKKDTVKQQINSPQLSAPTNHLARRSGPGFMHPNMVPNPPLPMRNPMPMPGPREPFFRPGNPQDPRAFGPRVPFIPPPMQRPPFPQPRPPFGPPAGMMPAISPVSFNGPRANLGNSVTVKFANLPPSTTFPFLCDLLAKCGQVMSVQLTTPGCAVATFGHPSHAERCFQSFNGMNVEGFMIEVAFA